MKKIIKFLAYVTDVAQDVRHETIIEVGGHMKNDAWWFSSKGDEKAYNVLHLYANSLKRSTFPNISNLRDKVRELDNKHIDGHNPKL